MADLWRAAGDYNYNTSLALINREEARRRDLENHGRFFFLFLVGALVATKRAPAPRFNLAYRL